ncbi:MAG: thioredoxin family protein [Bacteroidales bacterium]|nr:thioredoxin family protein [Bacteroidales bacterium]
MRIVKKIYVVVFIMLVLPVLVQAQVEFIEVTTLNEMEEVQKKASDQQLMLFVDVYATWCGPCKIMDKEVYTNAAVADYMNANFVNVRLDGETDYGRKYAMEQKLEGYPSMFVFSSDGDPVSRLIGFTAAGELVPSLKGTVDNYKIVKVYKTKYERGTLELEDFALYISVVREMGNEEESEKLASEYMERIMDPKLSDNDISVVAFFMDLEDTWWPEFSSDQERLRKVLGDDYMMALEKIYNNSLVKAVDEDNVQLISKMANELTPLIEEEETNSWDLRSMPFLQYYYYTNQVDGLINYVDGRFESDRKGDHCWLYGAASQITDMDQQYLTPELLEKGEEWFQTCIDLEEHFDYYFYHGMVLFFKQNQEAAKASFVKAESLATTGEQQTMIRQVLGFVNSK